MSIPNLLDRLSKASSRVTEPTLNTLLGAAGLTTIGFFISGLAPVSGIAGLAIGLSGIKQHFRCKNFHLQAFQHVDLTSLRF